MIKVLIITPSLEHGGTNKSLVNLLSYLDRDIYEIIVKPMAFRGSYKDMLANKCILVKDSFLNCIFMNLNDIKSEKNVLKQFFLLTIKLLLKFLFLILGTKTYRVSYKISAFLQRKRKFDCVIAFQEGRATELASYLRGYKIAWVRSDYREYNKSGRDESAIYSSFNHIVCVSNFTREGFLKFYPNLEQKSHGIHNVIDYNEIIRLSERNEVLDARFQFESFTLLSVGRLSEVKQFSLIPEIASKLRRSNYIFKWYIIGKGEEKKNILERIKEHSLEEYVILLGEKDNPYPYFAKADAIISLSKSEACPNIINEAKILKKLVITTEYGSVREFIKSETDGIITSIDNIFNVIEEYVFQSKEQKQQEHRLGSIEYDNTEKLKYIEKIIKNQT